MSRYRSQCWRQNLKTQDSGKGLWESWVGNSILSEPNSDGGFARFQRLLRRTHEFGESLRLVDGQVRENLPVEVDPGDFQTVHELAVIQPVQSRRSADADDPERAVITLLDLAPDVSEFERALNRFSHRTVKLALRPAIALRKLLQFFAFV